MPNQKSNAGNEGDVMKHAPLHKVVEHHSNDKAAFWYVETHTAYPYYSLSGDPPMTDNSATPKRGTWAAGIWDLVQNQTAPTLLTNCANVAYHDKQNMHVRFPDKRIYLGSAAQVFHFLKAKNKRVRMTLFELKTDPAQVLLEYFQGQGAKAVLVGTGGDAGHIAGFLRPWWDAAIAESQQDDFVMVVQGDSYRLAPALWPNAATAKPDLVFVDPFKIGDSTGQPHVILSSLSGASVPFMCWTPLSCVPNQWQGGQWSFEDNGNRTGNQSAQEFVRYCLQASYRLAWFSWRGAAGSTREIYGCQLTFGNIFGQQFTPASIWQFANQAGLPYLDLMKQVANPGQRGPNFQNPATTWRTPGPRLNQQVQPIAAVVNQPGAQWWTNYHATFWWP